MAGLLLDNIINETLQKSFGVNTGNIEESVLKSLSPTNVQLGSMGIRINGEDQLDTLTQSLQSVEMNQFERIFWILIFSLMVLIAAGGNIIVVYIVSTNKEMKSVTNYFLVNLSLADTMVSTLNVIFNFISMLNR